MFFVIRGIGRRQKRDIRAEGHACKFVSLPNRFAEGVWVRLGEERRGSQGRLRLGPPAPEHQPRILDGTVRNVMV